MMKEGKNNKRNIRRVDGDGRETVEKRVKDDDEDDADGKVCEMRK